MNIKYVATVSTAIFCASVLPALIKKQEPSVLNTLAIASVAIISSAASCLLKKEAEDKD